jgi:DNA repair protein RecO (recombination protein O)
MSTSDQAICIRTADYSETSQVVTFVTRAGGVVRMIAKGAKRAKSKTGGAIDLLAEGDVVYAGGGREALATLMEFVESASRRLLRGDLQRLNIGLYMIELTGALLAPADAHPEVFDLLHNALARLGAPDAAPPAVLAFFQWRLIRHVGLLGDMSACVGCGQAAAPAGKPAGAGAYFSSAQGGLVCRDCHAPAARDERPVSPDALAGLAVLAAADAGRRPQFPPAQAQAVNALLAYHIEYQLGHHLKTTKRAVGK